MNSEDVLGVLGDVMQWSDERSRKEYTWLLLMARLKYDAYNDFLAGARFIENLVVWLQQFKLEERDCAYDFVRNKLTFVSIPELRHLVELFYPNTVQTALATEVASILKRPTYGVWSDKRGRELYRKRLRKTLFVELSDGARIDMLRRANTGLINNEQVVTTPSISPEKWEDMVAKLREDLGSDDERFSRIFLIDDFTGSGTTLIRQKDDNSWAGKLRKFWTTMESKKAQEKYLESEWKLNVHHYIATTQAYINIAECNTKMNADLGDSQWPSNVQFSYGTLLPPNSKLGLGDLGAFGDLVSKYYDTSIESKHMKVGGTDAKLGFSGCGLPLILEHNTPNNSIALLWAETDGTNGKYAMKPLFRRKQRHT